jgi:hypothetical protein
MIRHPRTMTVIKAKSDIAMAVYREAEKRKLTDIELMQCLTEAMTGTLKYALRIERHVDLEIGADEAPLRRRKARP